jgi:hypothetical protein
MRWFATLLLGLYLVFIARLTLADPAAGHVVFSLADNWASYLSGGRLQWSETEVLANIALFVPAGFLLAVVLQRPLLSAALCVLVSACIELAQQRWFPSPRALHRGRPAQRPGWRGGRAAGLAGEQNRQIFQATNGCVT